jgi:hypothetical protein
MFSKNTRAAPKGRGGLLPRAKRRLAAARKRKKKPLSPTEKERRRALLEKKEEQREKRFQAWKAKRTSVAQNAAPQSSVKFKIGDFGLNIPSGSLC